MRKRGRRFKFTPLDPESPAYKSGDEWKIKLEQTGKRRPLGRGLTGFTHFQKQVYRAVLEIPLGEVRTYKWVAGRIGRPRAWRAVGSALNKNPLPLFIPCHRVIKSSGDIGKYSQGVDFKRRLIKLEKNIKDMIE